MVKEQPAKTKPSKKQLNKTTLTKSKFDFGFLFTVCTLLALGLLMVFSASYPYAHYYFGDGLYFIKRQFLWTIIGAGFMAFTANFDYRKYKKYAFHILAFSFILLVAVLIVGINLNGAKRWLGFGSLTFQPSEVAKIALIIYFASGLSEVKEKITSFSYLFRFLFVLGLFMGLLLLEPHFSICIIIGLTLVIVLLVAGARIRHFMLLSVPVIAAGIYIIAAEPYRLKRWTTFLDPFSDALGSGWQVIQSLYAIGSGGLFGVGFGNSRQKFLYVSEPQNDFIFSIVCEELGWIGAVAILILFGVLIWRGLKVAINAPDIFGSLLVTGIVALVGVQVVLNIAVVTSSIPTTGIPLPFFSAGGSSLLFLMAAMGMVLNVSRYSKKKINP